MEKLHSSKTCLKMAGGGGMHSPHSPLVDYNFERGSNFVTKSKKLIKMKLINFTLISQNRTSHS